LGAVPPALASNDPSGGRPAEPHQTAEPVINGLDLNLKFFKGEDGQTIIEVYDAKTGKVIRQIPPEDALAFLRQVAGAQSLQAGQLISRRA
jgi:FlaG protein